jgi:hypothetical protein
VPDSPPPFLRRTRSSNFRCDIFLSSGSDVFAERDRFEQTAATLNDQLYWTFWNSYPLIHLNVVRWEQTAPQKTGGDPNARFREQAERCHITVVLLRDDIRPGTKDELEAALSSEDVQLAVIWMEPEHPRARKTVELNRYLSTKKDEILWEKTGPPGSDRAWQSMFKIINKATFEVFKEITEAGDSGAVYYEQP